MRKLRPNLKQVRILFLAFILTALAVTTFIVGVSAHGRNKDNTKLEHLSAGRLEGKGLVVNSHKQSDHKYKITPTVVPTTVSTPVPNISLAPTTIPTIKPTVTLSPAPTTPIITSGSYHGVPICADHDPAKWHGLVRRNADGSIACTYTHEHKDDPSQLDSLFGPVAQYTGGQEISYPWQTHSDMGSENDAKHRVYNWEVVKNLSCKPSFAPLGFTNIRREVHADGNAGAVVRFHSFFLQAEGCDPKDPGWRGKITIGGVTDYGRLEIPDNNVIKLADSPGPDVNEGFRRAHMSIYPSERNGDFTWYGGNCTLSGNGEPCVVASGGIRKEDWGPLDPAHPEVPIFSGGGLNGSYMEPAHLVATIIPEEMDDWDGRRDGKVTYRGYTNKNGNINKSCSAVGPDCVPLVIEDMKVGYYQFRNDSTNIGTREYDVKGPTGQSLIQYPN